LFAQGSTFEVKILRCRRPQLDSFELIAIQIILTILGASKVSHELLLLFKSPIF